MTSNINVTSIDENYPYSGLNQSSQGFRNNFAALKHNVNIAGLEISNIHDKRISITGDGAGQSGPIGSGTSNPSPIVLTLAPSGVIAGTYSSLNNELSFTVDTKGRIISATATPLPTRPVNGTYVPTGTVTPNDENTTSLTVPSFTFDQYGTLTAVNPSATTFKFDIKDHTMVKGSILAGDSLGVSSEFPVPSVPFNMIDTWVLTWNPVLGTSHSLRWVKLPAPIPANPSKVIQVTPGLGIAVDNTDENYPKVSFSFNTVPDFPPLNTIQPDTRVLIHTPATNATNTIKFTDLMSLVPAPTFATKLQDDLDPTLGADLKMNGKKITGEALGIVMETTNAGPISMHGQKMPYSPGPEKSFLRIDNSGQMYWDSINEEDISGASGVTQITASRGIETTPLSGIIDIGEVRLNFDPLPVSTVNPETDYLVYQNVSGVYKTTIENATFQLKNVFIVDAARGTDSTTAGSMARPFKSISYALNMAQNTPGISQRILVMPGNYNESLVITKSNVYINSLLGPSNTILNGSITILDNLMETIIEGLTINIQQYLDDPYASAIVVPENVEALTIRRCNLLRFNDEYDRVLPIIQLNGDMKGMVVIENCMINGKIVNNLVTIQEDDGEGNPTENSGYSVSIENIETDQLNRLGIETGIDSYTTITNVQYIDHIIHNGGYLDINNVNSIVGIFTDDVYNSLPDDAEPDGLGYFRDGLISTATSATDSFLRLNNVNFEFRMAYGTNYVKLNKTGNCSYIFNNINRMPSIDVVNGVRDRYASSISTDAVENVKEITLTGNYTLRISESRTWDMTLNANATVTIDEDNYGINSIFPNAYANSLTVLVRQGTGGSNTIQFAANTSIIWPDGTGQPATATGVGNVSLYTFIRIGTTWLGSRSFNQV